MIGDSPTHETISCSKTDIGWGAWLVAAWNPTLCVKESAGSRLTLGSCPGLTFTHGINGNTHLGSTPGVVSARSDDSLSLTSAESARAYYSAWIPDADMHWTVRNERCRANNPVAGCFTGFPNGDAVLSTCGSAQVFGVDLQQFVFMYPHQDFYLETFTGSWIHTHHHDQPLRLGPAAFEHKTRFRLICVGSVPWSSWHNGEDYRFYILQLTGHGAGQYLHIHGDRKLGPAEAKYAELFELYRSSNDNVGFLGVPRNGETVNFWVRQDFSKSWVSFERTGWVLLENNRLSTVKRQWANPTGMKFVYA